MKDPKSNTVMLLLALGSLHGLKCTCVTNGTSIKSLQASWKTPIKSF